MSAMASMIFKMNKNNKKSKEITVSFNAKKFERIAADFGFFREEFLESLEKAEKDIGAGRTKKIRSLSSIRN